MQKLRILPLAAFALAFSIFTGCDSTSDDPTITGLSLSNSKLASGSGADIRANITFGTSTANVSYKVTGSSGEATSKFTITTQNQLTSSPATLTGNIVATSATDDNYTLTITVTDADGKVASASTAFTVGTNVVPVTISWTSVPLSVGSMKNNDAGSFISFQDGYVYALSDGSAKANASHVDLFFTANPSTSSTGTFFQPAVGQSLGLYGFSGWSTVNSTTRIFPTTKSKSYFTSSALIAAEFAANTGTGTSAVATTGGLYVVQYAGSKYAVLSVESINDKTGGNLLISVNYAN